jgi:ABC-type lipoprotein release transport system permease subunit
MGATRLLSPWLYGVSPTDPTIFAGLSLAMVAIAVLACWIPARRATRVDPVETLRTE